MKKFLLIQFRDDVSIEHERQCFIVASGLTTNNFSYLNAITDHRSKFDVSILPEFDGVILGGSGQYDLSKRPPQIITAIENTKKLIEHILSVDFPAFGVCFGHQILSFISGSKVEPIAVHSEGGLVNVFKTKDGSSDSILEGLPDTFKVITSHKETVMSPPAGAKLLLTNEVCPVQSLRFGKNVYSSQFHPELGPAELKFRWGMYPEYVSASEIEKKLSELEPVPFSKKFFENFIYRYKSK